VQDDYGIAFIRVEAAHGFVCQGDRAESAAGVQDHLVRRFGKGEILLFNAERDGSGFVFVGGVFHNQFIEFNQYLA